MKTYSVSMKFFSIMLSDEIDALSSAKAKYAFFKMHSDGESDFMEWLRHIKCKCLGEAKPKQPAGPSEQQLLVDKVNAAYDIGDSMNVLMDDNTLAQWTVRHKATILGGHSAVIWANECVGCYDAKRILFPTSKSTAI